MQSWQDFLSGQTLNPLLAADCTLTGLSQLGLMRIQGDDTRDFLQGQLTNDIMQVNAHSSQLSGYCNPKGRMLANFRIYAQGDALFVILPSECLQPILKRLRMFVLRARVTLEDVSAQYAIAELAGECAASLFEAVPSADNAVLQQDGLTLMRIPGDRLRLRVIGAVEAIQTFWQNAAQQADLVSEQAWRLLDIRAGIPTVYAATAEAFVPQMTNMQLLDGVNFKKGCYTGQEVVARMHYLGKLKRRMYRMHIDAGQMPQIGEDLYPKDAASEQSVGRIAEIAPAPEGGYAALVVGQISYIEAGNIRLGSMPSAAMHLLELPYTLS